MIFRKSKVSDIPEIMRIINQAKTYLKSQGIDQWQNGYPNENVINNDINNDESYVVIKDDKIIGTTVISFNEEVTYNDITNGEWLTNDKCAVIHRIAVDNNCKGLGLSKEIIKYAQTLCLERNIHSIKIDTHEKNISMQNSLKKNNFQYCGDIFLFDGAKRVAFEKTF